MMALITRVCCFDAEVPGAFGLPATNPEPTGFSQVDYTVTVWQVLYFGEPTCFVFPAEGISAVHEFIFDDVNGLLIGPLLVEACSQKCFLGSASCLEYLANAERYLQCFQVVVFGGVISSRGFSSYR